MPLSRREQAEYDRLRQKRRGAVSRERAGDGGARRRSRRPEPDDDGEDGVYVFSGRHAENFLDRLFGPGAEPDDDDEDDDDEDGDDEDDDDPGDPPPPAGNRFFRRGGR